jgi:hypothetical protein
MERGKKEMEASIQRREKDIAELVWMLLDPFSLSPMVLRNKLEFFPSKSLQASVTSSRNARSLPIEWVGLFSCASYG